MKKRNVVIAICGLALSATAVSCTKENVDMLPVEEAMQQGQTISYSIDGIYYSVRVNSDEELQTLYHTLLALAAQQHAVIVYGDGQNSLVGAKDVLTYTTKNESEAIEWADARRKEGYTVSITIDHGMFVCTAFRPD